MPATSEPGARLGDPERGDPLAADRRREEALLLLVGAELPDRRRGDPDVRADARRQPAGPGAAELLVRAPRPRGSRRRGRRTRPGTSARAAPARPCGGRRRSGTTGRLPLRRRAAAAPRRRSAGSPPAAPRAPSANGGTQAASQPLLQHPEHTAHDLRSSALPWREPRKSPSSSSPPLGAGAFFAPLWAWAPWARFGSARPSRAAPRASRARSRPRCACRTWRTAARPWRLPSTSSAGPMRDAGARRRVCTTGVGHARCRTGSSPPPRRCPSA